MNGILAASECSSGCESGWTLYLDHSILTPFPSTLKGNSGLVYSEGKTGHARDEDEEEDEEEDLSMVSDASSGPPIFQEDCEYGNSDSGCFYRAPVEVTSRGQRKKKSRENMRRKFEEHPSLLDDTASSPIFTFSRHLNNNNYPIPSDQASMENILDFSGSCSATHFEVRSALHEPFSFFPSSQPGNQLQQSQWHEFGAKMG